MMNNSNQAVVLVSLGPGDEELITLKGLRALENAACIFCPCTRMPGKAVLSRSKDILLKLSIAEQKIRLFEVPMSNQREATFRAYRQVAEEIAGAHRSGDSVALVAEGDSGFYSSIEYIAELLQEQTIPLDRIAGVPAFIACGALANLSIVKQKEKLCVIPGSISSEELKERLKNNESIVIMKLSQCEESVKQVIATLGSIRVHYFENAGVEGKAFYSEDKAEIAQRSFPYFSIMIIQNNAI